ncbi:unnamed protein product [Discosporangium mesarthrocarpum]
MEALDFKALLEQERKAMTKRLGSSVPASNDGATSMLRKIDTASLQRFQAEGPSSSSATLPPITLVDQPKLKLEEFRVGSIPSIFYIPDFVTEVDEQSILSWIYAIPDGPEWKTLRTRRLQCWGGQPGKDFLPEPLPPWMDPLCDNLVARGVIKEEDRLNHILLNEYQPGQGILAHTDGPYYAPLVATLSLGSDAIMHFSPRVRADEIGRVDTDPVSSLVLRRRCLVVFTEKAYTELLHSIDAVSTETVGAWGEGGVINGRAAGLLEGTQIERQRRISLTFRRVLGRTGEEGR